MTSFLKKLAIGSSLVLGSAFIGYQLVKYRKVKDLKGKSALVTGAANGLGRKICVELAKKKEIKTLILWDIEEKGMIETKRIVNELHPTCDVHFQKINLADKAQIYATADKVVDILESESPYLVINNAGLVSGNEGILGTPDNRIELETKVNTLAHVWITKAFLPRMVTGNGGHFVNIVSLAAYVASGDLVAYAMSKKGAKGFAEGLNAELALKGWDKKVKVTLMCPGHILTDLFAGFESDSQSMTADYVAEQCIEAIEHEKGLVCLPKDTRLLPFILGISESLGYINLPLLKDFNPMKKWKSKQTDKIYNKIV